MRRQLWTAYGHLERTRVWTANVGWLGVALYGTGGTHFTTANASVHYGNDGGFAAASFSDGAPPFNVFSNCATPSNCWATALLQRSNTVRNPTAVLQVPQLPQRLVLRMDDELLQLTVHDWVPPPAIAAGGYLLNGAFVSGVQTLDAAATDAGGGARSVRVSVNGIPSRSVDFCPPNYAGQYYRT